MSRVRTLVSTEVILVVGLVVFVFVGYGLEWLLDADGPVELGPAEAIALSAVPALLWICYFYLQDRHEPEPKHYVAAVYLGGAFVAPPVAEFLAALARPDGLAMVQVERFSVEKLVWWTMVVGLAQELAKYAVVRYSIYLSAEYDEPMDGIIYMTAAGIGYATYENYRFLQGLDGKVYLGSGAANAVIVTLAHACFAGVLGYAMGVAKFSNHGAVKRGGVLLLGLLVAAALNGQFAVIEGIVKTSGLTVQPWRGVAYAAGFAAVVFLATSLLMRRHLAVSPHHPERAR